MFVIICDSCLSPPQETTWVPTRNPDKTYLGSPNPLEHVHNSWTSPSGRLQSQEHQQADQTSDGVSTPSHSCTSARTIMNGCQRKLHSTYPSVGTGVTGPVQHQDRRHHRAAKISCSRDNLVSACQPPVVSVSQLHPRIWFWRQRHELFSHCQTPYARDRVQLGTD